MQADHGYGRYAHQHASQHDCDEPGGAVCSLGRGLGDAHGVDESVREEEEKLHDLLDDRPDSLLRKLRTAAGLVSLAAGLAHLLLEVPFYRGLAALFADAYT